MSGMGRARAFERLSSLISLFRVKSSFFSISVSFIFRTGFRDGPSAFPCVSLVLNIVIVAC
jgi:hypothetical protein